MRLTSCPGCPGQLKLILFKESMHFASTDISHTTKGLNHTDPKPHSISRQRTHRLESTNRNKFNSRYIRQVNIIGFFSAPKSLGEANRHLVQASPEGKEGIKTLEEIYRKPQVIIVIYCSTYFVNYRLTVNVL